MKRTHSREFFLLFIVYFFLYFPRSQNLPLRGLILTACQGVFYA